MTDLNTRIVISATDKTGAAFGKARKGIDSISSQLGRLKADDKSFTRLLDSLDV